MAKNDTIGIDNFAKFPKSVILKHVKQRHGNSHD
jgi:hypothetical protein